MSVWSDAGLGPEALSKLESVEFVVTDLPKDQLGLATPDVVYIDRDAAGHGWFVDSTPWDHLEFNATVDGDLVAAAGTSPAGRVDLLTVIAHEYGHVLGFDHADAGIMDSTLPVGVRRLVVAVDAAFADQ